MEARDVLVVLCHWCIFGRAGGNCCDDDAGFGRTMLKRAVVSREYKVNGTGESAICFRCDEDYEGQAPHNTRRKPKYGV